MLQSTPKFSQPGEGAFIESCIEHTVVGQSPNGFNGYRIQGVSPQEALAAWWASDGTDPADSHTYLPCRLLSAKEAGGANASRVCNPTCITPATAPSLATTSAPPTPTPAEVATAVANALVGDSKRFINWEGGFQYGGAVTALGISAATGLVDRDTAAPWLAALDRLLDQYLEVPGTTPTARSCDERYPYGPSETTTRSCAWALLHRNGNASARASLPADEFGTVGDKLGLFPVAYLERYKRSGSDADARVATAVVTEFVDSYPHTLGDGTISRTGGCCGPPPADNDAPFLWADDQFMGLALMSRVAAAHVLDEVTSRRLMDKAAVMQLQYSKHLRFTGDGLSAHGAWVDNNGTTLRSCCKWGRANGWGALSRVEVLTALDAAFPDHPQRGPLLADFQNFIDAMLAVQDAEDGRWRQLVDVPSTYLETSVTAMMVTALAKGIRMGWFDSARTATYEAAAKRGWAGLTRAVDLTNGTVSGVCQGTGIQPNATAYAERPHAFEDSAPGGVGAVLLAARAMEEMHAQSKK